jgi:uracil-DNA glycosylase
MEAKIHPTWKAELEAEFNSSYFLELKTFLAEEKKRHLVSPLERFIFNAFELTPFPDVKVVLVGQDPYTNIGQAHGLCFSVPDGIIHPRLLINVFRELNSDLNIPIPKSGNLEKWAKQGVLLLNAMLTVRVHTARSHRQRGWEQFTDAVIQAISQKHTGIVFLLWGNDAKDKAKLIDTSKHFILETVHPVLSERGFFGSKHFSKTNEILINNGKTPIDWDLTT